MVELRPSQYEDQTAYVALILDLDKAVTECSDTKTYMRIIIFLFLAVGSLCLEMMSSSEKRKKRCELLDAKTCGVS